MRIAWATQSDDIGNQYGFSHGNRWGQKCLRMAGVEICADADTVVHHCPPHAFSPVVGKRNVLWTAWEFPILPDWETQTLDGADIICVTARFLVDVFSAYTDKPVHYVPQGIDTETYFAKFRNFPKQHSKRKPFRCLWIGASNERKGFQFLLSAWQPFGDRADMELYMKTTLTGKLVKEGNVTFDSRDLSQDEMVKLYQSADCFAFPSMAEGFGFTLGEAMACGLPCIYTPCTSLTDIAGEHVAIPLKYQTGKNFTLISPDKSERLPVEAAAPDVSDLASKILWVKRHAAQADKIGRSAAAHIRKCFTWNMAGRKLRHALESS